MAMSYQLQAAIASSENCKRASSVSSSQPSVWEKASKSVVSTEVIVPTLEAKVTVSSSNTVRRIGISRTKSSLAETEYSGATKEKSPSEEKPAEESEEKSTSEIHTFAVQGGDEEMSMLCSRSDLVESRCDTPDTLASSGCDEFVTKSSEVFDSPLKTCRTAQHSSALTYETIVNQHMKDLEQHSVNDSDVNSALLEDLVHIVEFYIDLCEQGPKTSLKALLKQVRFHFIIAFTSPTCRPCKPFKRHGTNISEQL